MITSVFRLLIFIVVLLPTHIVAQPGRYSCSNAHSHNDYQNADPFNEAYAAAFGSIEVDIFLYHDSLVVGHTLSDMQYHRTIENLYLNPLLKNIQLNNGHPYKDATKELQLLIDIKTEPLSTLRKLIDLIKSFPLLIASPQLKLVITGNKPPMEDFDSYPSYIWFDGELGKQYSDKAMKRIVMLSGDFKNYTTWNGKGNLTEEDQVLLDSIIKQVHLLDKKIRFWDSPDFINAWYQFINLKVDYINTDHIGELSSFLSELPATSYTSNSGYPVYEPGYKIDGIKKPVKNIILLIGDGTALPQLFAGYTANHGALNIFKMRHIGISKTSSYNKYITDSAPGATSISSGVKTNNHYVGVDHTGARLKLLPAYFERKKIKTGLVTCGDITDATPAAFYAHQRDRGNSIAIIKDLKNSAISVLMGSGNSSLENVAFLNDASRKTFNNNLIKDLEPEFSFVTTPDSVSIKGDKKWIVVDARAGLSMLDGRGDWLMNAFSKTLAVLSKNREGFFIMTEGAQIDYGGHENNLSYVATEVADFDKVVGRALSFADTDSETLVIVTADHETGGLSLLDGDFSSGYVSGRFSTTDHTALPVPVFAYGPGSEDFCGVYENTELFFKIIKAIGIKK